MQAINNIILDDNGNNTLFLFKGSHIIQLEVDQKFKNMFNPLFQSVEKGFKNHD